jgi:hypothetical protein
MGACEDLCAGFFLHSYQTAACLSAERFGDCWMDALTRATTSGVVTVRGRPGSAEPVALSLIPKRE